MQCFKRLSTRLLLLTLLWVSFISTMVGYTMWLNWELEASAASTQLISDIRYHAFRAAQFTQKNYPYIAFTQEVSHINQKLRELDEGDPWRPLSVPKAEGVQKPLVSMYHYWGDVLSPKLKLAREESESTPLTELNVFAEKLSNVNDQIDAYRQNYRWQLRYIQITLIILAFVSLGAIMFLLVSWVINPLGRVGRAIQLLSAGDLNVRIQSPGEDEIGEIAVGLNRMAERLKDLYVNLEQKVAEKTASVEEKNSHLAQLYEMISYLAQQRSQDDIIEGFTSRIMRHAQADACGVWTFTGQDKQLFLSTVLGVEEDAEKLMAQLDATNPMVSRSLTKGIPLSVELEEMDAALARALISEGFKTGYVFPIRCATGEIGAFMLLFKLNPELTTQTVRLLESFAVHLGVAIENANLIERDRQFAVVQERQLLAQGLHDSIAQALSFLNLQVQFLDDAIKNDDKALRDESLSAIRTGVQDCYEDVRELLLNFRERVHKTGFVNGVKTLIDRFEAQSHVNARLVVTGNGPELTPNQKLQTIFIIQEALSNVRKHAQASNTIVCIHNDEDLVVTVEDDGVGIDPKLVEERKGQHVGLSIMSERAARIGATVEVENGDDCGTRVILTLKADARRQ